MERNFGGVIWTNHALERMRERGIKQGDAWATWRNPQESKKGTATGSWVYYRNWNRTQIEVVAKQNEKKEWIILSVWSRPVTPPKFFKSQTPTASQKLTFWRRLYNWIFKV
jgi:Domain of unknown function (DUF4258)